VPRVRTRDPRGASRGPHGCEPGSKAGCWCRQRINGGHHDEHRRKQHHPGPDPDTASSYSNYASFSDPDGNLWLLQEITKRLPGRTWEADPEDVAARAALLKDTAIHHGSFEAVAPPHDWWDWYAAYMLARQAGNGQDEAAATANRYMAEVKHIVVSSS
jgi:hypothetical protein